jgi:hypothetical protein
MTNDIGASWRRLIEALTDPDRLYDRDQLAHLMTTAVRWGYELRTDEEQEPDPLSWHAGYLAGYRQRQAEENAAYPPPRLHVVTTAGQDAIRVHRARAGVDVVAPRPDDYRGGPVAVWDADRPDPVPDRSSVKVRTERGVCVWKEA